MCSASTWCPLTSNATSFPFQLQLLSREYGCNQPSFSLTPPRQEKGNTIIPVYILQLIIVQVSVDYDVLLCHCATNGHYQPPSPKGSVPIKPITIRFYSSLWRKLLDFAKAHMHTFVAAENAFPQLNKANECLLEVLAYYQENNLKIKASEFSSSL